jgi:uncharacterized protein with PQ loop repeat
MSTKSRKLNSLERFFVIAGSSLLIIILCQIIFQIAKNVGLENIEMATKAIIFVAFLAWLIWYISVNNFNERTRLAQEQDRLAQEQNHLAQEYEDAKDALRKNPERVELRELALHAARQYHASLREGTLTIYDEQAISNDLSIIIGINPKS